MVDCHCQESVLYIWMERLYSFLSPWGHQGRETTLTNFASARGISFQRRECKTNRSIVKLQTPNVVRNRCVYQPWYDIIATLSYHTLHVCELQPKEGSLVFVKQYPAWMNCIFFRCGIWLYVFLIVLKLLVLHRHLQQLSTQFIKKYVCALQIDVLCGVNIRCHRRTAIKVGLRASATDAAPSRGHSEFTDCRDDASERSDIGLYLIWRAWVLSSRSCSTSDAVPDVVGVDARGMCLS